MPRETLVHQPMTHMEQAYEAGCVPTTLAMALSGFGVNVSEKVLIDRYFPTAGFRRSEENSGVIEVNIVAGTLRVLEEMDLKGQLRLDLFDPILSKNANSSEPKYIVPCTPKDIRRGRNFYDKKNWKDYWDYYSLLEELVRHDEIGVYTANTKRLGIKRKPSIWDLISDETRQGFYSEVEDFIAKGHIMGTHGGMTNHMRAVDGTQVSNGECLMLDPSGESFEMSVDSLIWLNSDGVRGSVFDRLFRISLQDQVVSNTQRSSLLGSIKNFITRR